TLDPASYRVDGGIQAAGSEVDEACQLAQDLKRYDAERPDAFSGLAPDTLIAFGREQKPFDSLPFERPPEPRLAFTGEEAVASDGLLRAPGLRLGRT
ncbi:MAG: hypothetical protein ACYDD1_19845, partial [Caulobacteraceae bacterium]